MGKKYIEGAKSPLSNKTFVGGLIEVTLEKGHISPFNVETSSDGTPISVDEKVGDLMVVALHQQVHYCSSCQMRKVISQLVMSVTTIQIFTTAHCLII